MSLLALLFLAQDAGALIDKLSSDQASVREEAERGLVKMGRAALDPLKKAARTTDPEAATRIRSVLRRIKIDLQLWDFDVAALAKSACPKSARVADDIEVTLGDVTEINGDALAAVAREHRIFEASYRSKHVEYRMLAVVDIDGETFIDEPTCATVPKTRYDRIRHLFTRSGIVAKSEEEIDAVAKIWVRVLTGVEFDRIDREKTAEQGWKVTIAWRHGKTGSWTDFFIAHFDKDGRVQELAHEHVDH